tara:strand:+ start:6299 stop:8188 length:1890 start_codon:yes stop_codon:yes gene_type:complete
VKKIALILVASLLVWNGCTQKDFGNSALVSDDVVEEPTDIKEDIEEIDPSTVYPFPGNECVECKWYFCPPLDSVWQKQICVDYCEDPPRILHEGQCEEYLECDPGQYLIEQLECITEEGFPGTQDKVCNKGKIQYTDCITDCEEESCNYKDDDCDDEIDEGQLNECGECGVIPAEECNNYDDDCDDQIDEGLIQACSTACGSGYELCDGGNWISCTAPPENDEICDGLDNDCDGQIDEGLECVCTIQDVGVLFPCQEDPLLCGQGYKTCQCVDSDCKTLNMTECFAFCYWIPPADPADCDPLIGMPLNQEKCNNFDDNCNQQIDEDLYTACYTGPEGTLMVGICEPGIMTCDVGIWGNYNEDEDFIAYYCKDEIVPQEEICNGIDDDCDGITDWGEEMKDTDVLFIVDWSGSMSDEMDAVMIALNQFAQNFSDEEVIKWAFMRGPVADAPTYKSERLELQQDLIGFSDFLTSLAGMDASMQTMQTAYEMILDAVYLAVHNITGTLPQPISDFQWSGPAGTYPADVIESVPPLQSFEISWRPGAERIIIVFTDEHPQSYLSPQLTTESTKTAISGVPQLKLYTFSRNNNKIPWEQLANAGGGEWYKLTNNPTEMYASLMEILDEICKGDN